MGEARYKQVVDRLAAEIRAQRLPPGSRLPTHRKLAAQHGLALATATRVYAELAAMGLVSGETGRGTFVRETQLPSGQGIEQQVDDARILDLSFNYPTLPGQAELLRSALRQLASGGDLEALLRYQPHGGRPHERAQVAAHLARRGLTVSGDQLLLVDGAQHGLSCTLMALLQPGDVVAVDALSYPGFKVLAQALHLELLPLPAAGQGPDPQALDALCRRRSVKALYTMPTLHNPLGWVMSLSHRKALVAVARRHGLLIIEDAAYAYLVEPAPLPLAALAPELTVYVNGFSKSVATGLRVGCVVASLDRVERIARAIRATTWNTPGVMTALVCGWLADGTVARLEAAKRADARARQALAAEVLGHVRRLAHPASYFVWLPLGEEVRADRVAADLLREGLAVSTAEPYVSVGPVPHALRLALGSLPLAQVGPALARVAAVLNAHSF